MHGCASPLRVPAGRLPAAHISARLHTRVSSRVRCIAHVMVGADGVPGVTPGVLLCHIRSGRRRAAAAAAAPDCGAAGALTCAELCEASLAGHLLCVSLLWCVSCGLLGAIQARRLICKRLCNKR